MELKAHFSNIHKVIIHHLEQAQTEIVAAIAWFTDRDIFYRKNNEDDNNTQESRH